MTRPVAVFALCAAITLGVLTTVCTSTVQGAAVKPRSSVPTDDAPPLDESALDGLMLSNSDLNRIAEVEMESFYSSEEMNDNGDLVSDIDCLGAIYRLAAHDDVALDTIRVAISGAMGAVSRAVLENRVAERLRGWR